ncbi:MAG: FHA domain-containing protein [Anaerolineales bacterium]|nr:FHA domain-containing protein [Anaerolineales bacterium]
MNRTARLYYYGVMGAIGGVIGWQVSNLIGLSFTQNVYLSEVVVGAMIGLFIGLMIGLAEGLFTRNWIRAGRSALLSGLLGLVGGAVGLPLAEGLFQLLGGQAWARVIGWGIFGLLIGLAASFTGGSQIWKGALGGLLGGIMGSLLLDAARAFLADPLIGKAAGLLLLGASVGTFIALIVFLLSKAWLEVASGKLKGTEFILDKFLRAEGPAAFIGSDALKSDIVLPDPDVSPQHAMLKGFGTHFNLKDMSLEGTFINSKRIEQAQLKNHQTIQVGNTQLVYHEKR